MDFHTQKGDKAAAAGADGDADRLRDAVNVIFGVQGAGRPNCAQHPACALLACCGGRGLPDRLQWTWARCVSVSFVWCCEITCSGQPGHVADSLCTSASVIIAAACAVRSLECTYCSRHEHIHHAEAHRRRLGAGLTFSWWSPLLFLFPFTAPLVRPLAAALPDAGFRRILAARRTIKDVAFRLIAAHRAFLAQVAPAHPACRIKRRERAAAASAAAVLRRPRFTYGGSFTPVHSAFHKQPNSQRLIFLQQQSCLANLSHACSPVAAARQSLCRVNPSELSASAPAGR